MSARLGMYMKSEGRAANVIDWLDNAGLHNLNELCKLFKNWPNHSVEVLVKWQRQNAMQRKQLPDGSVVDEFELWSGTRQFELAPLFGGGITGKVGLDVPGEIGILTTQRSIEAFLADCFSAGQAADRRALMFWGHADGPGSVLFQHIVKLGAGNLGVSHRNGLSPPAAGAMPNIVTPEPDWLSLFELEGAFGNVAARSGGSEKIDLLCFDACQDATLELAAVLAPHGKLMIANQSSTPISGWPFDKWPAALDTATNPSANDAAISIVNAYASAGYENSVISAVELGRIPEILRSLRTISDLLLSDWQEMLPVLHRAATQCLTIPQSFSDKRDLIKLFRLIGLAAAKLAPVHQPLARACGDIVQSASDTIIAKSTCKATPTFGYNGLSIYLPDGSQKMSPYAMSIYAGGSKDFGNFKSQTRWDEVVQRYTHYLFQSTA